jgi:hypothetical protein
MFGDDLADLKGGWIPGGSRSTWPALLAQHKSMDYECWARSGSGNLQILEQILNQATTTAPAIFVIAWSFINRFDYYRPRYHNFSPWQTLMSMNKSDTARLYYRDLQSEYCDKLSSLAYIKLAVDTLKQKQVPFVMTYMDESLFNRESDTSAAVTDFQDYVQPYMTKFDGQTFLHWSQKNGYPISNALHPLEAAHSAAAELIKSYNLI